MKKTKSIACILFIIIISNYCYSDNSEQYMIDMQRFYGGPSSPRSYVDPNGDFSMESYRSNNDLPFPGPQGSYQSYPFPNSKAKKELFFQPCDGSMTNGTLEINSKTAQTALYSYDHVIIIDGTAQAPKLNDQGKYVDKQGKQYVAIGSMNIPIEDASDTNTYYLFGKTIDKQSISIHNSTLEDYNSMNE